jgi:hypothetical protein
MTTQITATVVGGMLQPDEVLPRQRGKRFRNDSENARCISAADVTRGMSCMNAVDTNKCPTAPLCDIAGSAGW